MGSLGVRMCITARLEEDVAVGEEPRRAGRGAQDASTRFLSGRGDARLRLCADLGADVRCPESPEIHTHEAPVLRSTEP